MIYWVSCGILYLLILTYQDYKKNKLVDDRYNYFMMGVTFSLLSHYSQPIWYIFGLLAVSILLMVYVSKTGILGDADSKTLFWSFFGFGIISFWSLLWYSITFTGVFTIHTILKIIIYKTKAKAQGYPIFLISFIVTSLLFIF